MKRHGFAGQGAGHGNQASHRRVGGIGAEDQALEDYIQRQLASTRAMVAAGWNEDGAP